MQEKGAMAAFFRWTIWTVHAMLYPKGSLARAARWGSPGVYFVHNVQLVQKLFPALQLQIRLLSLDESWTVHAMLYPKGSFGCSRDDFVAEAVLTVLGEGTLE